MTELPILDISAFRSDPESVGGKAFVAALLDACHTVGFAHLVGHGIDPDLERRLFVLSRRFFALPIEQRRALALVNSAAFRGYTSLGDERTRGARDWRDQLDYGPEQLAPPVGHDGPAWLRLRGPNQWPAALPELAPVALAWLDEMLEFGLDVLRALSIGLGQSADHFDSSFVPTHDLHAKIIRYPERQPTSDQGVGTHHDSGVLTFILQDDVPGLHVQVGDEFIPVEPMAGAYVMNLGAMMQTATNGYLRATPHRVVSPTEGQRISIVLFYNPAFESTFDPLELPPHLAAHARPEPIDLRGERIHTRFGENNLKVRLRSHPDVAQRHYGDIDRPN